MIRIDSCVLSCIGDMVPFQARIKPEDESWFTEGLTQEEAEARLAELEETRDAIARSQEVGWWA